MPYMSSKWLLQFGIDIWPPANLRRLLSKAIRVLAQILQEIEHRATCPSYLLYNIIVLMGKPRVGARPTAPMLMLNRI
eukprot:5182555-Karenia_brevis.AAC.1